MKNIKNIYSVIILSLITALFIFSCNLAGEGIYRSIQKATEMDDSKLRETPVSRILGEKNEHLLVSAENYTEKGKIHGFKDNSWATFDHPDEDNIVKDIVFDGTNLYARGMGDHSNKIFKDSGSIAPGEVNWNEINIGLSSDETVMDIGVLNGNVFIVTIKGDTLKIRSGINFVDTNNLKTDLGDKEELSSVVGAQEYIFITLIEGNDDPEDYDFETLVFDNNYDSVDVDTTNAFDISDVKINGAIFDDIQNMIYITAFDGEEFYILQADTTGSPLEFSNKTNKANGDFILRKDGETPMMKVVGEDTILIGGRTGLYKATLDNDDIDSISRPTEGYYTDALNDTVINGFYQKGAATGYDFYLATRDYWVYKVDNKDSGRSLGW